MSTGNIINSPALITLLLHYHCRADKPHSSPVNDDGTELLLQHELIESADRESLYTTTDRGRAHVQALCDLPVPEIQ